MASEVPDELMRLYDEGLMRAGEDEDPVRVALAAVLARHEQMVRAKVAEEIRAEKARGNVIAPYDRCIAVALKRDPEAYLTSMFARGESS